MYYMYSLLVWLDILFIYFHNYYVHCNFELVGYGVSVLSKNLQKGNLFFLESFQMNTQLSNFNVTLTSCAGMPHKSRIFGPKLQYSLSFKCIEI